jgi:hypothetical protein
MNTQIVQKYIQLKFWTWNMKQNEQDYDANSYL